MAGTGEELAHGGDACIYAVGTVIRKEFRRAGAFQCELEALRAVQHESIVTLVGICWDSLHLYLPRYDCDLCAALLSGRSLDQRLVFSSLLGALRVCHGHSLVHRDVKPENVLVMLERPSYVLCDFARSMKLPPTGDITAPFCGTTAYASPESLRGSYGRPSDVFSMGVVLFAVLEQGLPFFDEELKGDDEVAPPLSEGVDPSLGGVLRGLLKWKPQQRLTAEAALQRLTAEA